MSERKKKVLIVTYYWPPSGGSGVQRWTYFAKYLNEFGHDVTVITVDPKSASYRVLDTKLVEMVKDVEVITTKTLEPLKAYSFLKSGSFKKEIPAGHVGKKNTSIFEDLSSFIRNNFFVPDARIGWVKYAFKALKKYLSDNEVDIVITTGPPHSTHLVGLQLKQHFPNQKWIADFRDPWSELFYEENVERLKFAQEKNERYERSVIDECDYLLTVGPSLKEILFEKGTKEYSKIGYILNGYESSKFSNTQIDKRKEFTISFVGTIVEKLMNFEAIVQGIDAVAKANHTTIKVEMAGNIPENVTTLFSSCDSIEFENHGYVNVDVAYEIMQSSNVLFTVIAKTKNDGLIISGKVLEYLASGTPTLILGNTKGDVASLVEELPYARLVSRDDYESVQTFISEIFLAHKEGRILKNDSSYIEKYSREATARQLASLLNDIYE